MESVKVLNGIHLKIIACAAMFTDHACKVFIRGTTPSVILTNTVGRIAFPLFAFLLLEGFLYTRNRAKYARNLLITALISEPFFDKALHGEWIYWAKQNTCFTLLLGLLMLICLEKLHEKDNLYLMMPVAAAFLCAFYFMRVDYGLMAGVSFLACYLFRFLHPWFIGLIISTILAIGFRTPGAYLCMIPLALYNKKRGNAPVPVKYLFYAFYPAHLLFLSL